MVLNLYVVEILRSRKMADKMANNAHTIVTFVDSMSTVTLIFSMWLDLI